MALLLPTGGGENLSPEAALEILENLWQHRFHLIPCGSPTDVVPKFFRSRHPFDDEPTLTARWAKTPRVSWKHYQRAQPTWEEVKTWHQMYPKANWAAITGIPFAGWDADSDQAVEWFSQGGGSRTPLRQKTPRGGSHFFYSIGGVNVRNSTGSNNLDVRGEGGYVLITPSKGYEWKIDEHFIAEDMDDLPALNQTDLENILAFNNEGKVQKITQHLTEDPVKMGERNDTLARLVGRWIKEGWGQREVLIKAQDWNQTLAPPMGLIEVTQTTVSIIHGHIQRHPEDVDGGALRWQTSNWHVDLTEELKEIQSQEDPIEAEPAEVKHPLGLEVFTHESWTELDDSTVEQYWGDRFVFQRSRVLLLGKPKIGKSNWLGAFAAAATTGTEFMGVPFSRPLKVVWLQAEIIREFIKSRVEMYYRKFESDPDLLQLGYSNLIPSGRLRKNLMRDGDIQMISDEIAYHEPDLVMIDPIINFFDGEENNNAEIHKLLDRIDLLIEAHNICVIVAHHTGKERADDKSFMSARGGSAFAGWFDSGIKLLGEKPDVNLFYEARNAQEPNEHLAAFDFDEGEWKVNAFTPVTPGKQVSEEDQVIIARVLMQAMESTVFYRRKELEILARQALKKAKMPNGINACQKAVTYVQKYLGDKVKTYADPGKAVWHYLASNDMQKPWEVE